MKLVNHFSSTWLLALVAAAVVAGSAFGATQRPTGAPAHGKHTIQLREASAHPPLTVLDLGTPGLSPGDQVVTTDGLVRPDGTAAGSMSQVCSLIDVGPTLFASTFDCAGSLRLEGGQLTVHGAFLPVAATSTLAVTGGTGDFARARGQLVIATESDDVTIELA